MGGAMHAQANAILAAIDHLGGGTEGVKKIGALLNVTTARVYKMREEGVVKKAEHARILARNTPISFEQFLLLDAWPRTPDDDGSGRKTDDDRVVDIAERRSAAPGEQTYVPVPGETASLRVGRAVRPSRSARSRKSAAVLHLVPRLVGAVAANG